MQRPRAGHECCAAGRPSAMRSDLHRRRGSFAFPNREDACPHDDAESNAARPTVVPARRLARRRTMGAMTTPGDPAVAALVALVAATRPGDERDEQLLRDHVVAYGWSARVEQMAPQHLLVHVKETFRSTPCRHLSSQQLEMLLDRAITWAIRGYYASADAPAPASGD